MKVILIKDLKDKGKKNDVIEVADGYAKNYLIKEGYAVAITNANLHKLNQTLTVNKEALVLERQNLEEIKAKLEQLTLNFKLKTHVNKIFGTISLTQIVNFLLTEFAIKIDKKKFIDNNNLTTIGLHYLKVKLGLDVIGTLKVMVEQKES